MWDQPSDLLFGTGVAPLDYRQDLGGNCVVPSGGLGDVAAVCVGATTVKNAATQSTRNRFRGTSAAEYCAFVKLAPW